MRRFILISLCALISIGSAEAKKKAKDRDDDDRGRGRGHSEYRDDDRGYSRFRHEDVVVIEHHYRGRPEGLPPGLAKRDGDLPPGLAKHLRRNGQLPPGLQKRIEPFPVEVERRLPPLRRGLRRGLIGGRALIYGERTFAIIDVSVVFGR